MSPALVAPQRVFEGLVGPDLAEEPRGELALDLAHPDALFDAALGPLAATGGLRGTVTPLAGEGDSDTCALTQEEAGRRYLVASDVTMQDAVESFRFPGLPAGAYSVWCERRTQSGAGDEVVSRSMPAAAAVTVNDEAAVAVAF